MENLDFLRKDLIKTFNYTTTSKDRSGYVEYNENGRKYRKYGTWQAITYIGLLYKVYDTGKGIYRYIYHVGYTKQHPCDLKNNKELSYENAYISALTEPVVTVTFDQKPSSYECMNVIYVHMNNVRLRLLKTPEEINNK